MIIEMEIITKQTAARAHVGVFSRERPDESPPAITYTKLYYVKPVNQAMT